MFRSNSTSTTVSGFWTTSIAFGIGHLSDSLILCQVSCRGFSLGLLSRFDCERMVYTILRSMRKLSSLLFSWDGCKVQLVTLYTTSHGGAFYKHQRNHKFLRCLRANLLIRLPVYQFFSEIASRLWPCSFLQEVIQPFRFCI